jgi:hypothetical protein
MLRDEFCNADYVDLLVRPGRRGINRLVYGRKRPLDPRPTGCEQHNNSDTALGQVLLILEVSIWSLS